MIKNMKKAVVVLSGGLDSTVCMSIAKKKGYDIYPITFSYGQSHSREIEQAKKIANYYECRRHLITDLDFFKDIGASALTSPNIGIPTDRDMDKMGDDLPVTYVPFRNAVFLSMAVSYAESIKAECIYTGVNALDYSGYPDCRPEFIAAFQKTVDLGSSAVEEGCRIRIETPLVDLTKGKIVKLGLGNKAPLHLTTSCYLGGDKACGKCDSCQLRLKGFKEAGVTDPIEYEP